jgi:hypothetical protein
MDNKIIILIIFILAFWVFIRYKNQNKIKNIEDKIIVKKAQQGGKA